MTLFFRRTAKWLQRLVGGILANGIPRISPFIIIIFSSLKWVKVKYIGFRGLWWEESIFRCDPKFLENLRIYIFWNSFALSNLKEIIFGFFFEEIYFSPHTYLVKVFFLFVLYIEYWCYKIFYFVKIGKI